MGRINSKKFTLKSGEEVIIRSGEFGITTRKGWRDKGVGRIIITELLYWAEKNPIIKKVCLGVFSNNKRAIHLYKSLGFEEEGCRKQHIRISEDEYLDDILMYKFVK